MVFCYLSGAGELRLSGLSWHNGVILQTKPMQAKISQASYLGLAAIAAKVNVGIIAVADTANYPIVFASHMGLLGYSAQELMSPDFGGLASLLPERIRKDHPQWMEGLKRGKDAQVERAMGKSREIFGVSKSGEQIPILINISYQSPTKVGEVGLFLAFIQSPQSPALPDSQLSDLKISITTILAKGEKARRHMARLIAKRIATGGGIGAVLIGVLSQIPAVVDPLFKIYQASRSAVKLQTDDRDAKIGSFIVLDDEKRLKNMYAIRSKLGALDPKIKSISYYRISDISTLENNDVVTTSLLKFVIDTEGDDFNTYFPGDVKLSPGERQQLNQGDCVVKQQLGAFHKKEAVTPTGEYFDAVFFPTLTVKPIDYGLKEFTIKNVVGVAVRRDQINPQPTKAEPTCTLIFRLVVNLENLELAN